MAVTEDVIQYHVQRLASLRTDRGSFENQWEEAASVVVPAHRNAFQTRSGLVTQGEKKTEHQFDATASSAAYRFASVMESLATPQNSTWHRLRAIDSVLKRNRRVRIFFDEMTEALFNYRYRPVANFVGNSQQTYLGLGVYGNGVLFIDRPDAERGLRYRNIHLSEAYFVENHAGIVDTVYRPFPLTARQIMQQFGPNVPDSVKEAANSPSQVNKKFEVLHCVYPRTDTMPGRMDPEGKPFASLYIFCQENKLLREGGFNTFPFAITRYTQAPGEVYGRGPAQHVLPSIKVLNEQKKTILKQGHRTVDPPLLTHDDGNLGAISLKAGALNAGGVSKEGRLLVQPLPVGRVDIGDKLMQFEIDAIHDAFLITLFQILIDSPQMTATEVLERAREKGMLLAPTAGRMQAEFLGPMIDREIDLLAQQGLLPKIPPILLDAAAEYRVWYDNPMSRMQRAEGASGFLRALDVAGNYAKMTNDLEPLDHFNFDVAMPAILDIEGAPTAWTRSEEDIIARRESRAQQQQTQTMIEAAPAAASLVKSIGQ